jgi:hypothetical protein
MLYREIIAVCSQIHTKHINTLCGQNVELLNVKLVVHILTTLRTCAWVGATNPVQWYVLLCGGVQCVVPARGTRCATDGACVCFSWPTFLRLSCQWIVCLCAVETNDWGIFMRWCHWTLNTRHWILNTEHLHITQHQELFGSPDCVISETSQRFSMKFGN